MYLEAIQEVIGPDGTLVVPTFNFGFARGERYDPAATPSKGMGAFSEYRAPAARSAADSPSHAVHRGSRALCAMTWPAGIRLQPSIPDRPSSACSSWISSCCCWAPTRGRSRCSITANSARMCLTAIGKISPARCAPPRGWQTRTYRMFVRDLELDPQLTLDPVVGIRCRRWGSGAASPLNYGQVTACSLRDFVAAADKFLAEDPWSLVTNLRGQTQTGKSSRRQA